MSPSEKIRALLDERGIEWWQMHDVEVGYYHDRDTEFVVDGKKYTAHEWGGRMTVYGLTPEQAIAATVGVGTCQIETTESWLPAERYHRCKHCGAFFAVLDASHDIPPRVCPNCGKRITKEEDA